MLCDTWLHNDTTLDSGDGWTRSLLSMTKSCSSVFVSNESNIPLFCTIFITGLAQESAGDKWLSGVPHSVQKSCLRGFKSMCMFIPALPGETTFLCILRLFQNSWRLQISALTAWFSGKLCAVLFKAWYNLCYKTEQVWVSTLQRVHNSEVWGRTTNE